MVIRGMTMTIEIAKIKGVSVVQDDDGRVHWTCGSAVDADGSNGQNGNPFAHRTDNKGLDLLANAGFQTVAGKAFFWITATARQRAMAMGICILKRLTRGRAAP